MRSTLVLTLAIIPATYLLWKCFHPPARQDAFGSIAGGTGLSEPRLPEYGTPLACSF